ncbi:MAG: hypothetical protein HY665_04670, partial [Chloroflexi bacterium]|nr:hypothetical protein [Chloroflexota bacterium]
VLAHSNLADVLFKLGAIELANDRANKALELDEKYIDALLVRGKIEIEQRQYDKASQSFAQVISAEPGNPLYLLWSSYARYLKAQSCCQADSKEYQDEISGVIRQLERARELYKKGNSEQRSLILYYLGCFYYMAKDVSAAKKTLAECVNLKSGSVVEEPAREKLSNIWDYVIKPPWWRWWLSSPLHPWLRRATFGLVSFLILALLGAHPFVPAWFPKAEINDALYIAFVVFLFIVLAGPSIEHIKAKDIEVGLRAPPNIELVFSLSVMEKSLQQLEKPTSQRQRT